MGLRPLDGALLSFSKLGTPTIRRCARCSRQRPWGRTLLASGDADHYTSLWVVDDGEWTWVRAAKRDASWLVHVESGQPVRLQRDGDDLRMIAEVHDTDHARERVSALMAEKYGIADWLREVAFGDDTVAVRLGSTHLTSF